MKIQSFSSNIFKNSTQSSSATGFPRFNNFPSSNKFQSSPRDKVSFGHSFALKSLHGLPDPCSGVIMITKESFDNIKWPMKKIENEFAWKARQILKKSNYYGLKKFEVELLKGIVDNPETRTLEKISSRKNKESYKFLLNILDDVKIPKEPDNYADALLNTVKPFRKNMFNVEKTVFKELLQKHIENPHATISELFKDMRGLHEQPLIEKQGKVLSKIQTTLKQSPDIANESLKNLIDDSFQKVNSREHFKNKTFESALKKSLRDSVVEKLNIKVENVRVFLSKKIGCNDELTDKCINSLLEKVNNIGLIYDAKIDQAMFKQKLQSDIKQIINMPKKVRSNVSYGDLKKNLSEATSYILSESSTLFTQAEKLFNHTFELPTSETDADAFVVKYSGKVLDKATGQFVERDEQKIMQRFLEPSLTTVEHVFPQNPKKESNECGGASDAMNYIVESYKYNNMRGNLPFYLFIKKVVPNMQENSQKYIDKIIQLINTGELRGSSWGWYPAAIKKTLSLATRGKVELDISKLNEEYLQMSPPKNSRLFQNS